ncbi:MAG: type 1 glutamine amidotransferase [Candidatus Dadabacteria bacterium]|nr:type 1 glutamine amidotransferase [Candidatus Dadabacteria bacterium]MYE61320.1 type 1 glutamine amidotransferase [Candidatus Dadabacteria bacterium]
MPKLLVFQHVPHEILGTLDPMLRDAGFRIRYVNFGRSNYKIPRLRNYDGLVVLGGPMNVDEIEEYPYLVPETESIREFIEMDAPVLGVCLGSQLIAKALGARIRKNPEKEIGWYDVSPTEEGGEDRLMGAFGAVEKVFQWHGDTFEIPPGAVHLATSPACANQAFRYGDKVYGFQFHLEVDAPMIERWLVTPVNKKEIEELGGKINPDVIRSETPKHIDALSDLSRRTFGGFIDLLGGTSEKKAHMPSV